MSKCAHHITEHLWGPGLYGISMHLGCSDRKKALLRCTMDDAVKAKFFYPCMCMLSEKHIKMLPVSRLWSECWVLLKVRWDMRCFDFEPLIKKKERKKEKSHWTHTLQWWKQQVMTNDQSFSKMLSLVHVQSILPWGGIWQLIYQLL